MPERYQSLPDACRRQRVERRQPNLRSLFYALFMSRRQGQRREGEEVASYIDHYGLYTFGAALTLMLLCITDAYLTLLLMQYGSVELNPILAWAMHKHVLFFFLLKYMVTGLCVVVAVMHKHFRVFGMKGSNFLLLCLVGYACLIQYQLSMLLPVLLNHPN
jgi:hypothetical protein